MNFFSIAGLLLASTCLVVAIIVLIYGKTKLHRIWLLCNVAICIWGIGSFFVGRATTVSEALISWRFAHLGGVFIAVFFYHMTCLFCEINRRKTIIFAYIQVIFFQILNLTTNLFISQTKPFFGLYYAKSSGLIYPIAFLIWLVFVCLGHFELIRYYKNSKGIKRTQAKYLFVGFITGFLGGGSTLLPIFGINIYPFGNFTIPIYTIIATYAILKYRLMDIRLFISRAVAFLISYSFLLGVPFFFAYRMYPVLYPICGKHWWLAPVGLMTFFATLAPLAYDQIRRGVEERFMADQKRYQKLLLQAASGMAREHSLNHLSKLVVYIVKRIVKIDFAAIVLENKEQKKYLLKAVRDSGAIYDSIEFSYDDLFVAYLKDRKEPLLYEELPLFIRSHLKFPKQISLIVPSIVENNLLGFVVLGEKNNREHYTEDDINVFKILTHQTTMAIENCLFFEEFRNAQEKIFNAEKLASIGGMADGLAHQIKNRLNHFSIASGELKCELQDFEKKHPELMAQTPDLKKTFEYAEQISDSLITNVKRTDGIVKGILNYARVEEKETFFSYFSLKEIIDVSLELLKIKHETTEFPLKCDLGDSDLLYGVKAQIMEAIYNLIDNSYEAAIDKKNHFEGEEKFAFQPKVKLKLIQNATYSRIEISDNGSGIKEENKHKIFAPFFTTKSSYKSGTGIGMYVVGRIIKENHKGKIWFETAEMQGTRFIIELPKK